jgi:hypothetical protein
VLVLLTGCDLFHDRDWEKPLPAAVAVRAEGQRLEIWTGTPCDGVTRVDLVFDPGAVDPVVASYRSARPRQVETVVVGRPLPGFTAETELPADFDWEAFDEVSIVVHAGDDRRSAKAELVRLGDDDGDYLVRGEWLGTAEVAEGDGEDYGLLCSAEPG